MLHFAYPVRTIVVALLCFCYTVSGAQFEVVVGGPGVLQFNPPTVVSIQLLVLLTRAEIGGLGGFAW